MVPDSGSGRVYSSVHFILAVWPIAGISFGLTWLICMGLYGFLAGFLLGWIPAAAMGALMSVASRLRNPL
jgi:hypothetical protein